MSGGIFLLAKDVPPDLIEYFEVVKFQKGSVWTIPTAPFPQAHFATFPPALCLNPIKAGTSEKGCCPSCGAPWVRVVEKQPAVSKPCPKTQAAHEARGGVGEPVGTVGKSGSGRIEGYSTTLGWRPSCECNAGDPIPCTVLDPFGGAGTLGLVADQLGRDAILIELKEEYALMAERRIKKDAGMFAEVEVKK